MKSKKQLSPSKKRLLQTLFVTIWTALIGVWVWKGYIKTDWVSFNFILWITVIFALIYKIPKLKNFLISIIGEKNSTKYKPYRIIFPLIFMIPLVFYLLLGSSKPMPAGLEFNVIIIAPTLGGLVLAGATNSRIKKRAYNELMSVAQKLIVATVLFIIFVSLFFTVQLAGDIKTDSLDFSPMGGFRYFCFYGSVFSFYAGSLLFLLGIIDLVFALRHLKA